MGKRVVDKNENPGEPGVGTLSLDERDHTELVSSQESSQERPRHRDKTGPYDGYSSEQVAAANRGRLAQGKDVIVPDGLDDKPAIAGKSLMEIEAEEAGLRHPEDSGAGGDLSESEQEDK